MHEQAREDRDDYVRIVWNNIGHAKHNNFKKKLTESTLDPYDLSSIMHYGCFSFSTGKFKETMVPIDDLSLCDAMGQRLGMTANDIAQLQRMYRCTSGPTPAPQPDPTSGPTPVPQPDPTLAPTTNYPTPAPQTPSIPPTDVPTMSSVPTLSPTERSPQPTLQPTEPPNIQPTDTPTPATTVPTMSSPEPTLQLTPQPTKKSCGSTEWQDSL